MELLIELIQILGERVLERSAKPARTRASEEASKKNLLFLKRLFVGAVLVTSILVPAYFFYEGYTSGNLSKQYLYIGIVLISLTLFSNLLTLIKTMELLNQEVKTDIIYESSTVEDDIRYEMGLLVLLTLLSAIPVLNLIVHPLSIDRASNIMEMTANNSRRQRIRSLAGNIAFLSLIVFLASSLAVAAVLIILGDTRIL